MAVSYNKLWKLLIDRKMKKKDKERLNLPIIPLGGHVFDPFGSYTGIPNDKTEMPVQDADDL